MSELTLTSRHLATLNRLLPLLRRAYWKDGQAALPLGILNDEERELLPDLARMGCLYAGDDGQLYDRMPWKAIERLLPLIADQDDTVNRDVLRPHLKDLPLNLGEADKLLLLSSLGLVERKEDGVAGMRSRYEREMDAALSFIEQRDALQVRYGIFEPFMTIRDFVLDYPLPRDPLYVTQRLILWRLYQRNDILLLQTGEDPRLWQIRSRTAEIVRLLARLRKRQSAHRKAHLDPLLVRDVRWEMRRRTVPERDIPFERMLVDMVNDTIDPQHTPWNDLLWEKVRQAYLDTLAPRYPTVSQFQARSMRWIFGMLRRPDTDPHGIVITTATGSGKTLAFAAPILLHATLEKAIGRRPGVKAICIYPRQRLAENQLAEFTRLAHRLNRLLRYLGLPTLTLGIEYQGTPYDLKRFAPPPQPTDGTLMRDPFGQRLVRFWTWDATDEGWRCPYAECPRCESPLVFRRDGEQTWLECVRCHERVDCIPLTKEMIRQSPPDVLIITTESLHRRLCDPAFQSLFGTEAFTIPAMVALDEIHLYTSVDGAQVALLIRRLLRRLRLAAETLGRSQAPIVVGLSATIREPKHHMHRLTGLPLARIHHEQVDPSTDRVTQVGAEHYIFIRPEREGVQPLSCLARASQCLAHNMRQPEDSEEGYKILGFVDSLDIVGRWRRLMNFIEQKQHFALRDPEKIRQSPSLQSYAPRPAASCTQCLFQRPPSPDPNCGLFQIGECWWFMQQGGRVEPLRIQSARSGLPMPSDYDMTVATSVLEVGYDDVSIMGIVQYKAPRNVASFVQRKGRGGRRVSDRSITLTAINPNHANDVHLYRNAHVLTDPLFTKLPLNVENEQVLKTHGILSFFDYVAFALRHRPYLPSPWKAQRNVLPFYRRVLRAEWSAFERTYLIPLIGNNPRVRGQVRNHIRTFVETLEKRGRAKLLKVLAQELPRNLFSSINLPEVEVLDADRDTPRQMELLPVDQAMRELSPGRVTYRFAKRRNLAYWAPPAPPDQHTGSGRCPVTSLYRLITSPVTEIDRRLVPLSIKQLWPKHWDSGTSEPLPLYRPEAAYLYRFTHDSSERSKWDNWFYCSRCNVFLKRQDLKEHTGHVPIQVGDGSGSHAIGFVFYKADHRLLNPETVFYGGDDPFAQGYWFGPFARLFASLAFFNRNAGEYLDVYKVHLGSEVWVSFTDRPARSWVYVFTRDGREVALGYAMRTEGVVLILTDTDFLRPEDLPEHLRHRLRVAAFCSDVLRACRRPDAPRLLPVSHLLEVLLILYHRWGTEEFGRRIQNDRGKVRKQAEAVLKRLTDRFPTRLHKAILEPMDDEGFWDGVVVSAFRRRLERPDQDEERVFINDVLFHSLKHALRDAVSAELGAEAGFDLGGWWHTGQDFPQMGDRREMVLFEFGVYGIGYMRDWFNKFPTYPQAVWNALEERMGTCPTGDEEDFLRAVLSLSVEELERIAAQVTAIREAASFHERQRAVEALDALMRDEYGLELSEALRRLLVRLFSEPLLLESGERVDNWRLYREVNLGIQETLSAMAYWPSLEELERRAYKLLRDHPDRMPAWERLRSSLAESLLPDEVERRVRAEMGKRILTACIDGCPDCLHGPCELETAPERSRLLLSRRVLGVAMRKLRRPLTVEVSQQLTDEALLEQVRARLARHCVAYLVYTRADTERIPRLVSALLSQPITSAGRRFGVSLNGSTYEQINLVNRDVRYRLSFRCYPLEASDAPHS